MTRILIPNFTVLLCTQIICCSKCHALRKVLATKFCDIWKIRNRIPDKERALIVAAWKSLSHWPNSQYYKPAATISDEYSSSSHYKVNTCAQWHTQVPDTNSDIYQFCAHRRRREVNGWPTPLLGSDAGVPSDGEPSATWSTARRGGTRWSNADLWGHHEGIIRKTSVWERIVDPQEVAVRRRRRGTEPPAS